MKKLPKIGKRGWLGVILLGIGMWTFIAAGSQAENDYVQMAEADQHDTYEMEVSAEKEGYASGTDYLAHDYRKNGVEFMVVGGVLVLWGYKKYGDKKPQDEKPTVSQADKAAM